jgi:ribosomal protein L40E
MKKTNLLIFLFTLFTMASSLSFACNGKYTCDMVKNLQKVEAVKEEKPQDPIASKVGFMRKETCGHCFYRNTPGAKVCIKCHHLL